MSTFDIALTAKLRHGELWKLVERFGSQIEAARQLGCSQQDFCAWVNMRSVPRFHSESFAAVEQKLMELTGKTVEELWPEEAKSAEWLQVPKTVVAHHRFELAALADMTKQRLLLPSPADQASESELLENLRRNAQKVLKTLSFREREIIKMRFGLGDGTSYTLKECAAIFRRTPETIRQIEAKAIRKMQQPSRAEMMLDGVTLD